eukprot:gnl/TRDRNA2_/TRDRNA2_131423_c0_seq3.p1 gnl/TRDRNA2_/TRDRNA2_131423_c0~~gnl/TRDRNA2_/TRDRNA2_131423_c0_seq3.p1  ORF type:complete len:171 (-),score=63.45 gnl/TRDRNA2_/TRDRNA2_131423_c0_seq3:59-571(-)
MAGVKVYSFTIYLALCACGLPALRVQKSIAKADEHEKTGLILEAAVKEDIKEDDEEDKEDVKEDDKEDVNEDDEGSHRLHADASDKDESTAAATDDKLAGANDESLYTRMGGDREDAMAPSGDEAHSEYEDGIRITGQGDDANIEGLGSVKQLKTALNMLDALLKAAKAD